MAEMVSGREILGVDYEFINALSGLRLICNAYRDAKTEADDLMADALAGDNDSSKDLGAMYAMRQTRRLAEVVTAARKERLAVYLGRPIQIGVATDKRSEEVVHYAFAEPSTNSQPEAAFDHMSAWRTVIRPVHGVLTDILPNGTFRLDKRPKLQEMFILDMLSATYRVDVFDSERERGEVRAPEHSRR